MQSTRKPGRPPKTIKRRGPGRRPKQTTSAPNATEDSTLLLAIRSQAPKRQKSEGTTTSAMTSLLQVTDKDHKDKNEGFSALFTAIDNDPLLREIQAFQTSIEKLDYSDLNTTQTHPDARPLNLKMVRFISNVHSIFSNTEVIRSFLTKSLENNTPDGGYILQIADTLLNFKRHVENKIFFPVQLKTNEDATHTYNIQNRFNWMMNLNRFLNEALEGLKDDGINSFVLSCISHLNILQSLTLASLEINLPKYAKHYRRLGNEDVNPRYRTQTRQQQAAQERANKENAAPTWLNSAFQGLSIFTPAGPGKPFIPTPLNGSFLLQPLGNGTAALVRRK